MLFSPFYAKVNTLVIAAGVPFQTFRRTDNAKYWSGGKVKIALLGLENQTDPNLDMPFRIIGYDGAVYQKTTSPAEGR